MLVLATSSRVLLSSAFQRTLKSILGVSLVTLAIAVAGTPVMFAAEKTCGPPNYCARTDRRIEPYKRGAPALGPAGSIVVDPSFGSRIVRATDNKSDPFGKGRSLMTPSSAEQNSWNANSTAFYVLTPSGQFVLYAFDPASFKVHERGVLGVPWIGEPTFSYTRPNILYGTRATDPVLQEYDTSAGKLSKINKVSDCLKFPGSDYGYSPTVSADDNRLSIMVGPQQDRNPLVYVFDRKLGCRWYNTHTGEIGGQWGPKGTITIPDRFLIHNMRMSKSGDFLWIQRSAGGIGKWWVVWDIATMNVTACPSQCPGHHAMGYSHLVGPSGQYHPMDLRIRSLTNLGDTTPLVNDLQPTASARYWYDQHFSWNNADASDSNPVCLSTYSGDNPKEPGTPLDTIAPWENEVLCVETDGKASNVWRFAHTYSTARNGFWSTPRGNVSLDGRYFMFTSDWQDQLGKGPAHILYRTDVFIVELR